MALCCDVAIEKSVEHRERFTVVRLSGAPSLGQFLSLLHVIAVDSRSWPNRSVLVDLRGIASLRATTDHFVIGQEVARQLGHIDRLASLVSTERITRVSEKAAQEQGANLVIFTEEDAAVGWLLE